jgi:hypothetical protein
VVRLLPPVEVPLGGAEERRALIALGELLAPLFTEASIPPAAEGKRRAVGVDGAAIQRADGPPARRSGG